MNSEWHVIRQWELVDSINIHGSICSRNQNVTSVTSVFVYSNSHFGWAIWLIQTHHLGMSPEAVTPSRHIQAIDGPPVWTSFVFGTNDIWRDIQGSWCDVQPLAVCDLLIHIHHLLTWFMLSDLVSRFLWLFWIQWLTSKLALPSHSLILICTTASKLRH